MILSTFILEEKLTLIMLRNLPKFIQQVVESKCGSQVVLRSRYIPLETTL